MLSYIKSVIGRRRHSTGASRAQAVLDRIRANWANTPQTPESTSRQRVRAWSRSNAKKIRAARKAEALTLKRERSRQRSLAPFYGAADPEVLKRVQRVADMIEASSDSSVGEPAAISGHPLPEEPAFLARWL